MSDLDDRIRVAAARVGSLNKLALAINVPRRTLGNWLNGTRPRPEALSAIAKAANVSLQWLLTGEGDPNEDGLSAALRGSEDSQLQSRIREEAEDEAFHTGLFEAFERIASITQIREPAPPARYPDNTPSRPYASVQRKIIANIKQLHSNAGIKLRNDDLSLLAMDFFADLKARVKDMNDVYEVEIVMAQLTHNLARDIEDAAAKPGSGKRSAS